MTLYIVHVMKKYTLYIIIHSGGIRYIGGNFFIMKKKTYNRCLWTVIYYIDTVCITKRGLVTV